MDVWNIVGRVDCWEASFWILDDGVIQVADERPGFLTALKIILLQQ